MHKSFGFKKAQSTADFSNTSDITVRSIVAVAKTRKISQYAIHQGTKLTVENWWPTRTKAVALNTLESTEFIASLIIQRSITLFAKFSEKQTYY